LRLYRYLSEGHGPRLAVAHELQPVDLVDAWAEIIGNGDAGSAEAWLFSSAALVAAGPQVWSRVAGVGKMAADLTHLQVARRLPKVRWLTPLEPVASLRDFLAFEDHVARGAERRGGSIPPYWYQAPIYYKGNHHSILGPDDDCSWPPYTRHLDFELELAMVVGKPGRDIAVEDAPDHIFGFTILNDFSARDVQAQEMSAWLGPAKGKDFANALGPCIVTADELGAQPDLAMSCRVNGHEWGRARSSDSHWTWAQMIAHVSAGEEIFPGDVYGSGTPGGCCGVDLGRRLQPGDVVELEVEGIGVLRNPIGRVPRAW
jgi:2-keto-4-pentenoate hydratase/2-oxohepta-3-ene-1,7-dioic acid hydratase in catechol pathway